MSQNQASSPANSKPTSAVSRILALIPGILLCIAVAGVSALLERAELGVFEHPYVEALVMAILLGMALRSFWKPAPRWQAGIAFSAKQLLEVAVDAARRLASASPPSRPRASRCWRRSRPSS